MRLIQLTKGKYAVVDDEDFDWVSQLRWQYNGGYATHSQRNGRTSQQVPMHRLIDKTPEGMQTDHINRDKLDNRKCNLRSCNPTQNQGNKRIGRNNTSGYRGVHPQKSSGKWVAMICIQGRNRYLGTYADPVDAARAYDQAAKVHFGPYAWRNVQ